MSDKFDRHGYYKNGAEELDRLYNQSLQEQSLQHNPTFNIPDVSSKITELVYKVTSHKNTLWEEKLSLYIRKRPAYIPERLWNKLINLVLIQTKEGLMARGRDK